MPVLQKQSGIHYSQLLYRLITFIPVYQPTLILFLIHLLLQVLNVAAY